MIGRIVLLMLMLVLVHISAFNAIGWQASGPLGWTGEDDSDSTPNLPRLYTVIDAAISVFIVNSDFEMQEAYGDISNTLNGLWGEAWNVAVGIHSSGFDMTLYAYAFRSHWFWANGVDGTVNLAIWKDYNCGAWVNSRINENVQHPSPTQESLVISKANTALDGLSGNGVPNVWDVGVYLVQMTQDAFRNDNSIETTFSVVIGGDVGHFGFKICTHDGERWAASRHIILHQDNNGSPVSREYTYLLFQTRAGNYRFSGP